MTVQLGRLDQAQDVSSALAAAQQAGKQPVRAAQCPETDLIPPDVVDRQPADIQVTCQCHPALQIVLQCLGALTLTLTLAVAEPLSIFPQ